MKLYIIQDYKEHKKGRRFKIFGQKVLNMLLVSDYFYTSYICQQNLKPDTCEPLQY